MNEQRLREAILEVLDAGDPDCDCGKKQWHFWTAGMTEASRLDFCDAVVAKLKARSLSPEEAAKLENATIGETFRHSHYEDVLRAQKQTS